MKNFNKLLILFGALLLLYSCATEQIESLNESELSVQSLVYNTAGDIVMECAPEAIELCGGVNYVFWGLGTFWGGYSPENNQLQYTEYADGSVNITGQFGDNAGRQCTATVDVWLVNPQNYTDWSAGGGMAHIPDNACATVSAENLMYYLVDESRSSISVSGCIDDYTDRNGNYDVLHSPADQSKGFQIGNGGSLFEQGDDPGISGWMFLRKEGTDELLDSDFNFLISCPPVQVPCSPCDGKVTELTLQYNGDIANANIVVKQKKDDVVVFDGTVQPGETFSFVGEDKKGTLGTEIIIYVNGAENTRMHTSCSQPIGPGVVSGDFEVTDGSSRNGGKLCPEDTPPGNGGDCGECEGKVTNLLMQYNGSAAATIVVKQKKDGTVVFDGPVNAGESFSFSGTDKKGTLGTEIILYVDGVENTRIHTSCSKPIGPGLISGDFEVLEGASRNGGDLCPVENTPPPPTGSECGECDGKATYLSMQYNGSAAATIVVKQKKDGAIVFDGPVNAGGSFSFSGTDKKGTLGTEIILYVDGAENTRIHTSCSQPLGPGLVSGDFEVLGGASLKGGEFCPVDGGGNGGPV